MDLYMNHPILDTNPHMNEELRKQEIYHKYKGTEHGELAKFIDNNYEEITIEFASSTLMLSIEMIDFNIVHEFPQLESFIYGSTESNGYSIYYYLGYIEDTKFIDALKEINSVAVNMIKFI